MISRDVPAQPPQLPPLGLIAPHSWIRRFDHPGPWTGRRWCISAYRSFIHIIYIHRHINVYICISVYVCMYVRMYACMHVCMYVCTYVCMYVCVRVCVYVCMYIYISLKISLCVRYLYRHACTASVRNSQTRQPVRRANPAPAPNPAALLPAPSVGSQRHLSNAAKALGSFLILDVADWLSPFLQIFAGTSTAKNCQGVQHPYAQPLMQTRRGLG